MTPAGWGDGFRQADTECFRPATSQPEPVPSGNHNTPRTMPRCCVASVASHCTQRCASVLPCCCVLHPLRGATQQRNARMNDGHAESLLRARKTVEGGQLTCLAIDALLTAGLALMTFIMAKSYLPITIVGC